MDGLPDRDLMCRYGNGDVRAFELLYARHKGPLFRYLDRRCFSHETAEEIFQEVWTRVIGARTRYRPTAKFTTWLYQLAHNCYVDHVRRSSRRVRLVGDEEATVAAPDPERSALEQIADEELARDFAAALAALPAEQKNAFLLHEEAGLTLAEIAQVTGVSRETVKSRLRYALGKLRRALDSARDDRTGATA
jgi:RNA polymerase sigma-70 factor (ECF subfamily)